MSTNRMSKRERVAATLAGKPVDRPAYGFWGHNYDAEFSLASHVSSVLWWQRFLQMDFLKVQSRASFHVEDWGVRLRYAPTAPFVGLDKTYEPPVSPCPKPVCEEYPVKRVEDWGRLRRLDPKRGALGERLLALRMIGEGLRSMGEDVPVLETVFSPISIAARLAGWEGINSSKLEWTRKVLRENPDALHRALGVITQSFKAYVAACLKAGVSGFLFATTNWASRDMLTETEYTEFGRTYDLQLLEAMQEAEFVVLHVCQSHIMLYQLADYPVHVISWAPSNPGNPSLAEVWRKLPHRAVMGGVSRAALSKANPDEAIAEVKQAFTDTGGVRWMVGPECSVDPETPAKNMHAIAMYLQGLSR